MVIYNQKETREHHKKKKRRKNTMTIKDLYKWAVENGVEDFNLVNSDYNYTTDDFEINKKDKTVSTEWEC